MAPELLTTPDAKMILNTYYLVWNFPFVQASDLIHFSRMANGLYLPVLSCLVLSTTAILALNLSLQKINDYPLRRACSQKQKPTLLNLIHIIPPLSSDPSHQPRLHRARSSISAGVRYTIPPQSGQWPCAPSPSVGAPIHRLRPLLEPPP